MFQNISRTSPKSSEHFAKISEDCRGKFDLSINIDRLWLSQPLNMANSSANVTKSISSHMKDMLFHAKCARTIFIFERFLFTIFSCVNLSIYEIKTVRHGKCLNDFYSLVAIHQKTHSFVFDAKQLVNINRSCALCMA